MEARPNFVGIVTRDARASLAFYRQLGLEIAAGPEDEPYAEATTLARASRGTRSAC